MRDGDRPGARAVAIIMDGNARWAAEHDVPVLEGHRQGARTLKQTVKDAVRVGLDELCVYAFSTENWSRPNDEVQGLMAMFAELIISETPELDEEGVRMRFIGRRDGVTPELVEKMDWAEESTAANDRLALFVAFNYGGRAEILDAAERYEGGGEEAFRGGALRARDVRAGPGDPHQRREPAVELPAVAIGVLGARVPEVLWPDFSLEHLQEALREFEARQRRFGAR